MTKLKKFSIFIAFALAFGQFGCGWLDNGVGGVSKVFGSADTAIVISRVAQIRTSYAVVAADLLEVKRGDKLDVLDQTEFEKVQWFRRART